MLSMSKHSETAPATLLFAINLRRLIADSQMSVNAWAKDHGLVQTTLARLCRGEMNPTLSILQEIAAAANLEVWQLLVPDLDPRNPPVLRTPNGPEAEFYRRIAEALDKLPRG